jgi:hypothetical protein
MNIQRNIFKIFHLRMFYKKNRCNLKRYGPPQHYLFR